MTHAYSKMYLESSQDVLGHAFDWVANTCNKSLSEFCDNFAKSRISRMFEIGYPRYVTGCNGAELVNFVREDLELPEYGFPHEFYADRSPEYWAGWVLAYFQWKTKITFAEILQKIPVEKILLLYPTGHEQDIRSVADTLSEWLETG